MDHDCREVDSETKTATQKLSYSKTSMMLPLQVVSMHLPPERHPQSLNELKLQVDNDLQERLQHRNVSPTCDLAFLAKKYKITVR